MAWNNLSWIKLDYQHTDDKEEEEEAERIWAWGG